MSHQTEQYRSQRALIEAFQRWQSDGLSELDIALLVAQVIDEQVDCDRVREQISQLASQANESAIGDVDALLAFLRLKGFAQPSMTTVDLTHSSIDWLLQQHQALPIVVAILTITLARMLCMQAEGVNFPGHFLLRVNGELVDPLALAVIQQEKLQLPDGLQFEDTLSKASPLTIGFRMLNNLKAYYFQFKNWPAMLLATEYQLAISHDEPSLACMVYFERGEYLQWMNDEDAALVEYVSCLEIAPDEALAEKAKARIAQIVNAHSGPMH